MKIFLCTSKHCYDKLAPIRDELEKKGHEIMMPNSYDFPGRESNMQALGAKEHQRWKTEMYQLSAQKIAECDVLLVVNTEKQGQKNYIGGATFLEMFKAFELHKPIYLYNPIPDVSYKDEILGFGPIVIERDLSKFS